METGKLNTRITIQKRDVTYSGGKKVEVWTDYYTCWSEVLDLFGSEKYEAYNAKLENTIKFKVRYCTKLDDMLFNTKEYRIVFSGNNLQLMFVDTFSNSKVERILQAQKVN